MKLHGLDKNWAETQALGAEKKEFAKKRKKNDVDKMTLSVVCIRKLVYQKVFV